MSRRGRPPLAEPRVSIKVSLPTDLVARVDLRFMDPLTGSLRLGERSRYIESLIRQDEDRAQIALETQQLSQQSQD
jgi:hypothetical protein